MRPFICCSGLLISWTQTRNIKLPHIIWMKGHFQTWNRIACSYFVDIRAFLWSWYFLCSLSNACLYTRLFPWQPVAFEQRSFWLRKSCQWAFEAFLLPYKGLYETLAAPKQNSCPECMVFSMYKTHQLYTYFMHAWLHNDAIICSSLIIELFV